MFGECGNAREAMADEPRMGLQRCGVRQDTHRVAANLKRSLRRTTTCVRQNAGREEPSHISKCEENDARVHSGRVTAHMEITTSRGKICQRSKVTKPK